MSRARVEYHEGVPRWFTYLAHLWFTRRCKRDGHVRTAWAACDRCGQLPERRAR